MRMTAEDLAEAPQRLIGHFKAEGDLDRVTLLAMRACDAGFRKQLAVIGVAAGLPFPIHPHMLRHACGFALAHARHDTRAIQDGSATATSSTPPATPSSPHTASRTSGSGKIERAIARSTCC